MVSTSTYQVHIYINKVKERGLSLPSHCERGATPPWCPPFLCACVSYSYTNGLAARIERFCNADRTVWQHDLNGFAQQIEWFANTIRMILHCASYVPQPSDESDDTAEV